ncbi:MAG: hypothetical protein LRY32_04150, partial [Flavobacterium sp.]|nr:hypothetical protein [Flavobacterium sp.]
PIKVLGTQENPDIKLGRKSEDLEETEYVDGVTPINNTTPIDTITPSNPIQKDSIKKDSIPKITPEVPAEKVD